VTDLDALLEQAVAALARPRRATYRLQLGPALRAMTATARGLD